MPRHDYILLYCYIIRRISFVGGVPVVGIPSTHWLMGGRRMPEGTRYIQQITLFSNNIKTIFSRRRRVSIYGNFWPWLTTSWICGCHSENGKRKVGRYGVAYVVCYWWFWGYPCMMCSSVDSNLYLYEYVHVEHSISAPRSVYSTLHRIHGNHS